MLFLRVILSLYAWVTFAQASEPNDPVARGWGAVKTNGLQAAQDPPAQHLFISTKRPLPGHERMADVVRAGVVQPHFRPAEEGPSIHYTVGSDADLIVFWVWSDLPEGNLRLDRPVIVSDRDVEVELQASAWRRSARVPVPPMASSPIALPFRIKCASGGSHDLVAILRVGLGHFFQTIQLNFDKDCGRQGQNRLPPASPSTPPSIKSMSERTPLVLRGVNVGTSRGEADVVADGVPTPEYASKMGPRWQAVVEGEVCAAEAGKREDLELNEPRSGLLSACAAHCSKRFFCSHFSVDVAAHRCSTYLSCDERVPSPDDAVVFKLTSFKPGLSRTIPEHQNSISFFVSSQSLSSNMLGMPTVTVAEGEVVEAVLSGRVSGQMVSLGESESHQLSVTFKCRQAGEAQVLVTVPLLPPREDTQHRPARLAFGFSKRCAGKSAVAGVRDEGLMVGLSAGTAEVVRDGFPTAKFDVGEGGELFKVPRTESSIAFYIRKEGEPQRIRRPLVTANSPLQYQVNSPMYVFCAEVPVSIAPTYMI